MFSMTLQDALLASIQISSVLASPPNLRRANGCCFHLTATGGPGGNVGQLSDGQNRIGQSNLPTPQAQYCIDGNGGITDSSGRGCILTPPTTQWQCDSGATPTDSFSVGCDGTLQYKGSSDFWSCPTNDNGGYNIYSQPVQGQQGCVKITLKSDNDSCKSGCPAPAPPPPPPPPSSGCPADLPSSFEYPHLIIPVDSSAPDKALDNSYNGEACKTFSSILNFDIPPSLAGKTCKLSFLLPQLKQLQTSNYWLSGAGGVEFVQLKSPATQGTTYNSKAAIDQDFGTTTLVPGHAYDIKTWPCPAGDRIGIYMSPKDDTCLNYFQDYNPCPLGLYITSS